MFQTVGRPFPQLKTQVNFSAVFKIKEKSTGGPSCRENAMSIGYQER
jgi:hypothetical protein